MYDDVAIGIDRHAIRHTGECVDLCIVFGTIVLVVARLSTGARPYRVAGRVRMEHMEMRWSDTCRAMLISSIALLTKSQKQAMEPAIGCLVYQERQALSCER